MQNYVNDIENVVKGALPRNQLELKNVIDQLDHMNGYLQISMTHHTISFWEGVLAEASKTLQNDYKIFGKPSIYKQLEKQALPQRPRKYQTKHLAFQEEDFSIFCILQISIEEGNNQLEEKIVCST